MGMLPSDFYNNTINIKQEEDVSELHDYLIDLNTGAIKLDEFGQATIVSGVDAIIVQIWRRLHTQKGGYIIFSDTYGSRIHELLGYGKIFADQFIEKYLIECIVNNYKIKGKQLVRKILNLETSFDGSTYTVNFDLDTIYGQASYYIDDMIFTTD